jgi:hypothetical protein
VKLPAADLGLFEWSGRTMERHRSVVRKFLGFRECSVADAEKLTAWPADHVCCKERRLERVARYLADRDLQREINAGLNVVGQEALGLVDEAGGQGDGGQLRRR